jgi:plasmid stabilization system protein ParE
MKVFVTKTAFRDLSAIRTFIASDSVDAASRVLDELHSAIRKLADMPGMGHQRLDVSNPAYRFWSVYSYVIAYRVQGGSLYVSRVIHGARNVRKMFRKK